MTIEEPEPETPLIYQSQKQHSLKIIQTNNSEKKDLQDNSNIQIKSNIDDFLFLSKLGDGAYSQVFKVQRKQDKQIYALKKVKLFSLQDKEKDNAINEVRILASINNINVIQYKEAFVDAEKQILCIVMEFADNGDLFDKINDHLKNKTTYEENQIWKIFIQIVSGLKSLHDMNIMHRDLKSANVFLTSDMTVKLGDMNVSKLANNKGLNYTQTGTPYYASPEVWKDEAYDIKSDMWSLGCVIYELITLRPPFQANDMDGLYKQVTKGTLRPIGRKYSDDLWKTVKSILQVDPKKRPNCDQILNGTIVKQMVRKYFAQDAHMNLILSSSIKQEKINLLKTISVSQDLKKLSESLPRSNYNPSLSSNRELQNSFSSNHQENQFLPLMSHRQSLQELPLKKSKNSNHSDLDSLQAKNIELPKLNLEKLSKDQNSNNAVGQDSIQYELDSSSQLMIIPPDKNSSYKSNQKQSSILVQNPEKIIKSYRDRRSLANQIQKKSSRSIKKYINQVHSHTNEDRDLYAYDTSKLEKKLINEASLQSIEQSPKLTPPRVKDLVSRMKLKRLKESLQTTNPSEASNQLQNIKSHRQSLSPPNLALQNDSILYNNQSHAVGVVIDKYQNNQLQQQLTSRKANNFTTINNNPQQQTQFISNPDDEPQIPKMLNIDSSKELPLIQNNTLNKSRIDNQKTLPTTNLVHNSNSLNKNSKFVKHNQLISHRQTNFRKYHQFQIQRIICREIAIRTAQKLMSPVNLITLRSVVP
eukprot:403351001